MEYLSNIDYPVHCRTLTFFPSVVHGSCKPGVPLLLPKSTPEWTTDVEDGLGVLGEIGADGDLLCSWIVEKGGSL